MTDKITHIQNSLKGLRLPYPSNLSDVIMNEYPYNCLEFLLDDAVINFSHNQYWDWQYTTTSLTYTSNSNSFNLSDYKIEQNRILETRGVYYTESNNLHYIDRINRQDFKRLYPDNTVTGRPRVYSVESDTLYLYPTPDQDYSFKIVHYKHFPLLVAASDEITEIPDKYQNAIKDDIKFILAALLGKSNAQELLFDYIESLSLAQNQNNTRKSYVDTFPKTICW